MASTSVALPFAKADLGRTLDRCDSAIILASSRTSLFGGASPIQWHLQPWPAHRSNGARQRISVTTAKATQEDTGQPFEDFIKLASTSLWGKGLPPGALVQVARGVWGGLWNVMMSQLAPRSSRGQYTRPDSAFRHRIEPGGRFPPDAGRYFLYAALSCPWAHRTLLVHSLKGLGRAVPLCVAVPGEGGLWEFRPRGAKGGEEQVMPSEELWNGCTSVREVYAAQVGGYDGRCTLPMLWDSKTRSVVNNESADMIQILNSAFNEWAERPDLDLASPSTVAEMDVWNSVVYEGVNNGVYKCGFATSQSAYVEAAEALFATLDSIDRHLASHRYLCGAHLSLADIRLFTTLYRFDSAYHVLFKCCRSKICEYEHLGGYLRDMYQIPGVSRTCDMKAIVEGYFGTLFPLNPGGIIPLLPHGSTSTELLKPHGRERIGAHAVSNALVN